MSAEPATSNGRRRASNGHADRQHTTLASRRSRQDGQDRARIETLTTEANRCHLAAKRAEQDYTRNAMGAGAALLKLKELVKEIVGYGHWDQWLQKNRDSLGFAPRTARLYMQLAELPDTERQRVADLQLREAARTLATRNPLGRR